MRINSIVLNNFGSYEGETIFNTEVDGDRNIILVGGKNGAGKTTLFTAIRICLYGYRSMGYKNQNSFYTRAITKLINNTARMIRPVEASVLIHVSMANEQGIDRYLLKRSWLLDTYLTESFVVEKNNIPLNESEVADFENYLLSLIPPELFNLYFFDGEKIADFFLEEGSNTRIKDAFLTLCGYDTFDIMRKNFKRIATSNENKNDALNEYISAKETFWILEQEYQDFEKRLGHALDSLSSCEAEISSLEKNYFQKGGITEEEWSNNLLLLKEEEKNRETYNALLKRWANELLPFLMIREQIKQVENQIEKENSCSKYRNFCEVLDFENVQSLLKDNIDIELLKRTVALQYGEDTNSILDLSFEKSALLVSQINQILDFDVTKIEKCKKDIKKSLRTSARIRQKLENSNISTAQEYMRRRAQLFEEKSLYLVQQVELEQKIAAQKEKLQDAETLFKRAQSRLEDELKKESINDISGRSIIMLDKLQKSLYRRQIERVEEIFRTEINILMRKTHFIDDIRIDDDFNTHIYRMDEVPTTKLLDTLSTNSEEQIVALLGDLAIKELKKIAACQDSHKIIAFLKETEMQAITLPIEIDKTSLSNGEKQIFIMALYYSLIQLCNHEIPFIIDTPFARIDTEHRKNISKHFFRSLKGQVFILSTNEEIDAEHVDILNDKIIATYMLENSDNKRTSVVKNTYFEV